MEVFVNAAVFSKSLIQKIIIRPACSSKSLCGKSLSMAMASSGLQVMGSVVSTGGLCLHTCPGTTPSPHFALLWPLYTLVYMK